jgi:hypothetical protein
MKRVHAATKITALLALLLLFPGSDGQAAASRPAESKRWNDYVASFIDSYFAAHPDRAVRAGRHEYD